MNRGLRIVGLTAFWVSTFVLVMMFLRWKQRMDLVEPATPVATRDTADGEFVPSSPVPRRAGLSLFDLPAPIDYQEFNSLLVELKATRAELGQRTAALDERQRLMERREEELRDREQAVQDAAQRAAEQAASARPAGPARDAVAVEAALDEDGLFVLAETYDAMRDPSLVAEALAEMPPAHAAEVLKRMSKRSRVEVVPLLSKEALDALHRSLLKSNDG